MMRFFILMLFSCAAMSMPAAHALSEEESDSATRTISDYIAEYVDVPEGATDWKVFSKTKEIKIAGRDKDGMDYEYVKPEFPQGVKDLDGKTVTVKGFMFPLEGEEAQALFLIGPFPVSCPFHYHVGPSLVIEVHTGKKPIEFSYDPITVSGRLELDYEDMDTGVFYRLKDAVLR